MEFKVSDLRLGVYLEVQGKGCSIQQSRIGIC